MDLPSRGRSGSVSCPSFVTCASGERFVPGRNVGKMGEAERRIGAAMRDRFLRSAITVAIAAPAVTAVILLSIIGTSAQAPGAIPKTPWGEPDLQGIWTDETDTPLQRSPKYA